jgi:TRAP-type C4-dicarboxylate transport system permease small subunit
VALRRAETAAIALLVSGMVLLAAAQIVLRNFFRTGILWAEQALGMALLWLTMLGALAATGACRHISIDAVAHLLPTRPRRILAFVTGLFAAVVCGLLAAAGVRYCLFQRELDASRLLGAPLWTLQLVIPVCLGLMSLRFALHAVLRLRGAEEEAP